MSTYTINRTDGTTLVAVPEATINTTACSLALVGRRAVSYGEAMAENYVKLLENFAHTTSPSNPMVGQLWFDKTTTTLKLYVDADWKTVVNITSGGGSTITADQLVSTIATGSPPLLVNSTTKVANLNADFVDGYSTELTALPNSIVVRDGNADIFVNIMHGVATSARYADVAERFAASEALEPGDVVEIGGDEEIEKAFMEGGSALGVISTDPAFRMNEGAGDDVTHPFVAFTGRVPCKVVGPVTKGERLAVSSIPGVAKKAGVDDFVIGRALESKTGDAVSKVMMVIGVK